jgi:hypothetical protein
MSGALRMSVVVAISLVLLGPTPARGDQDDLTKKWHEALSEKKGDWGWLGQWLVTDRCAKKGFRYCPHLGAVISGEVKKWPADFIADALKLNGTKEASQVCIKAWGCDLLDPALEMVAAGHRPDGKEILEGFLTRHEELWRKGAFNNWRPMFIRLVGWYGDKSLAPLISKMAKHKAGLNSDYLSVAAASWILGQWGNKDVLPECQEIFKSSSSKSEAREAREACINYFIEFDDKSIIDKLKKFQSNKIRTKLALAALGDKSRADELKEDIKKHKETHARRIEATTAMAALGDKKATKAALAGLSSGKSPLVEGYAKLLVPVRKTKYGKKALKALKKGLKKVKLTDLRSARAIAFGATYLLRAGDKSALPLVKKLFASDKKDFRQQMASCLAGSARNTPIVGPTSGLAGGVSVDGIGKILKKAYADESDAKVRAQIGLAWVMLPAVGGK